MANDSQRLRRRRAPSAMLEEWAIDAKTLQTFARHYETGEPSPVELINKLRASEDFGNGTWVTQQAFYTAISLNAHNRVAASGSTAHAW